MRLRFTFDLEREKGIFLGALSRFKEGCRCFAFIIIIIGLACIGFSICICSAFWFFLLFHIPGFFHLFPA